MMKSLNGMKIVLVTCCMVIMGGVLPAHAEVYSLHDVVTDVSKHNSNALYEFMQYEIANHTNASERGIFEPEFYASANRKNINAPNTVQELVSRGFQQNYTENSQSYELGLRGLLPSGGQWEFGFLESGRASSLINQYRTYKNEYQGVVKAKLRQPLMRGFGSDATRSKIAMTESDKQIAMSRYEQRMMEVVGMTVRTYWELYGALELQHSWQESLVNAKKMYDDLTEKSAYGKVAKTDLIEAESGMSFRRAELFAANSKVVESQNNILTLLNVGTSEESRNRLNYLEKPTTEPVAIPELEESYTRALEKWPNLKIAQERVQRQAVQVAAARNMNRPQLDFVGDYHTASLSSSMSKAQSSAFTTQHNNWSVGLEFSIPLLGGERGDSKVAVAEVGAQQAQLELDALKLSVSNSLQSKIDQLENTQKQMLEYKHALSLKKKRLDVERSKFKSGQTDAKSVLTLEEGYINYQRRFLDSLIKWKLAQVSMDVAEGNLLDKHGVKLLQNSDRP